jgi:hypothetical protein
VAMAVWDELKVILLELEGSGALSAYPDPSVDESRQPPFRIRFAPWATDVAEELHRRFGDDVELVVGLLHYPGPEPPRQHANAPDDIAEMDPTVMTVELDAPIVVASGHHTRGALRIHNTGTDPIVIATNGQVTARVVDPRTGEVVGGYSGFQALPLVYFRADADSTVVVPVLVGTASVAPELGYVVPAGEWAIQVVLDIEEGDSTRRQSGADRPARRRLRAPLLPITVT